MQFSICLWDFDPSAKAVDALRADGVTALELGASFLTKHDEAAIQAVGQWCRAAGIRLYACHPPFGGEYDLSLLDEDARQKAVSGMVPALVRAALMGAECAVIHPSSGSVPPEELERRQGQLERSLEVLLRAAEKLNVRLALENMLPGHIGCDSAIIRQIVEAADSPFLGVCFDVGHAHLNPGGVLGAFEKLREQIITLHLQDNDGNADRHLQPPYGTVDWAALVPRLIDGRFDFPWSVETAPWNGAGWPLMLREMTALFSVGLLTVSLDGTPVRVICQQCGRYCFGTPQNWSCACGAEYAARNT